MIATALAAAPSNADVAGSEVTRQLRLGLQHYNAGRIGDAIDAYQCGLAAAASEPPADASVETTSELHSNLGNACMVRGDLGLAAENYKAALRASPHLTSCWCNLGNVHLKTGKPQDAVALYVHALTLNPGHWPSRTNLVQALMATRQYPIARLLLTELLDERPHDAKLHSELGKVYFELNELESAIESFRQAAALDPTDADSIYWIGGIRQRLGDIDAAQAAYAEAAHIQPLIRRPAVKSPADFRVLALFAPFAGNLPTDYLFKDAAYDTDTLALFSTSEFNAQVLKQDVHVVVNLISDADQAGDLLSRVADLVDRLGRPTINQPRLIERTTRDAAAGLLQEIPGSRVPKIMRQKVDTELAVATVQAALASPAAVLVRPVGTHGGDDFEKIEDPAELASLLALCPATDRYLIEYVDYRSADTYFRKYRFIFVDAQILPYHLAIAGDWKVHHDGTDMADHRWMQREEEAFLNNPGTVFNSDHYRALREIQRRIGLDYFGIDCGLDRSGDLVVFEVNASMLVHGQNDEYPYKAPFVQHIKSAFDEMLRKCAAAGASECAAFG